MVSGNASANRFASVSGTVNETRKNFSPFSLERYEPARPCTR